MVQLVRLDFGKSCCGKLSAKKKIKLNRFYRCDITTETVNESFKLVLETYRNLGLGNRNVIE